jgi:HEPN domain-containing protein
MKPATEGLVELAEGDFKAAEWQLERPELLPRSVGFFAQQCVEKYRKAVGEEAGRPMPRIHDLSILFDRVTDLVPALAPYRDDIVTMTPFAAELRYDYDARLFSNIDEDAVRAAATMRAVRSIVRTALGLAPDASAGMGAG